MQIRLQRRFRYREDTQDVTSNTPFSAWIAYALPPDVPWPLVASIYDSTASRLRIRAPRRWVDRLGSDLRRYRARADPDLCWKVPVGLDAAVVAGRRGHEAKQGWRMTPGTGAGTVVGRAHAAAVAVERGRTDRAVAGNELQKE